MANMLRHNIAIDKENKIDSVMVEGEYRLGINDPSRTAAQWERIKGLKKTIGQKAVIAEFIKRVQGMQDNQLKISTQMNEWEKNG